MEISGASAVEEAQFGEEDSVAVRDFRQLFHVKSDGKLMLLLSHDRSAMKEEPDGSTSSSSSSSSSFPNVVGVVVVPLSSVSLSVSIIDLTQSFASSSLPVSDFGSSHFLESSW